MLGKWGGSQIQDQINFPPAQLAEIMNLSVPLYQKRDFLHEKYVVNGLSVEEIGLEIVYASSTVLKHLKLLGIPLRGNGKSTRPERRRAYGQKIVGRQVEVCKSEMAAIEKMKKLRKQEFTYRKIADILNSMGDRQHLKFPLLLRGLDLTILRVHRYHFEEQGIIGAAKI